ncbi:hypothetical protein [Mycolicibacterium grossiae]|uniref:Uncharacterized protein n=1 Tax=Mycolicibacterium grossiae TaxID=1552759 RepID=A0A1E8QB85_9MYCO|nr:hypothetical protein [Mycolicibacterium grossiae]OFJ55696.1 hypothetical protein BEL07_00320 [Mycolicibacterium grossiae]QEM43471.1 hypothetical protein FZ046_00585 [Mycolicibacterium grossiae]
MTDRTTSQGPSSDRTRIIRRQPDSPSLESLDSAPQTGIIRRTPTGPVPTVDPPTTFVPRSSDDARTTFVPRLTDDAHTTVVPRVGVDQLDDGDPRTTYVPRPTPSAIGPSVPAHADPKAASATATVAIISGWATAVIATSLITNWWKTDELFCIAIGFLTTVSAAATIGGLIALLLRRRIGRLLLGVGAIVALMIFAGLFVAGAALPAIVYFIPALPVATIGLALLPATARWCR